ncbi:hypothetical protein [Paraliomyxa miuraensis]|uniref:hypothetical protein n=1 Tax=Paraliomyxa miuraensis TaxID=376150 RepID=UPI00225895BF|nr:hypothetical protein [Paraliomyxa miuraensis]
MVDGAGEPVPCVELRTTGQIELRTDATGRAAFFEPGLMDTNVWFSVSGSHVQVTPDGFGFAGASLAVSEGGSAELVVQVVGAPPCVADDREMQRIARGVPSPEEFVQVSFVDEETGRGVPLCVLELGDERWVSDSGGHVALDPLPHEGQLVDATVWSHGYEFADDGQVMLDVTAGLVHELAATRQMPAERLHRVTGGGIHRDGVLLGLPVPLTQPVINGLVTGQDSVFTAVHRGALVWIWGDTSRPAYPLGNFHASGATSALPGPGVLDPELGIDLEYFVGPDGFSRAMAPTETVPGEGVTWLAGLVSVPSDSGEDRLHATFAMVQPDFSKTRFGMLVYDDANERFVDGVDFDLGAQAGRWPHENAFLVRHGEAQWVQYHVPVRIPATSEALLDLATYERFTPYEDVSGATVERDAAGRAVYRWRGGGIPFVEPDEGGLAPADRLEWHLVDVATADAFEVHENGSTDRNEWLGRWTRLVIPKWALGETWLSISDTPMGPWVYATRVVVHEQYSFYNPRHHRELDQDHGRRMRFDATYTNSFSGNPDRTPRYDYNQVMMALDVDRPELQLPVPIYTSERGELGPADVVEPGDAPLVADFFAPVGAYPGTEPVWWSGPSCEPRQLVVGGEPETPPLFWALPVGGEGNEAHVSLYAVDEGDGEPGYAVEDPGGGEVIAVVWRNPIGVALPVADYLPELRADAGEDQCLSVGGVLTLPELGDAPPGGSAHWELDGAIVAGSEANPGAGLHVLARVLTRGDGLIVRDEAIVRIGEPPTPGADSSGGDEPSATTDGAPGTDGPASGCGCRSLGRSSTAAWLLVPLLALVRRRPRQRQ